MALSDRERVVLDFERMWVLENGSKDAAIRQRIGCSPSTYYRALAALIDRDDAMNHDPLVVRRLRRDRDRRRRVRFEGSPAQLNEPTR